MVSLRDSVRSQAKIVAVLQKTFGTTIKLHLGVSSVIFPLVTHREAAITSDEAARNLASSLCALALKLLKKWLKPPSYVRCTTPGVSPFFLILTRFNRYAAESILGLSLVRRYNIEKLANCWVGMVGYPAIKYHPTRKEYQYRSTVKTASNYRNTSYVASKFFFV